MEVDTSKSMLIYMENFYCLTFNKVEMWFLAFLAVPVFSHYFYHLSDQGNEH